MKDLIRDSPLGLAVRFATKNKYLRHAEELESFTHPYYKTSGVAVSNEPTIAASTISSSSSSDVERGSADKTEDNVISRLPTTTSSGQILVDWYTTDDPENPQNWSLAKKNFIAFVICFYSFAVYFGSSISVGAVPEILTKFGVSVEVSSLALSLYVLGYGLGPMIFSPKPTKINLLDPAVLFSTVYTSLIYAVFYSFFESFPIIFERVYHFHFEITGLPFLAVLPALGIATTLLAMSWYLSVERHLPSKGMAAFGAPERGVVPGLIVFPIPFAYGPYDRVQAMLKDILVQAVDDEAAVLDLLPRSVALWAVSLGAISAESSVESDPWFVGKLRALTSQVGMSSWNDYKFAVQSVIWQDSVLDPFMQPIWLSHILVV